jgi:hypothetical protein
MKVTSPAVLSSEHRLLSTAMPTYSSSHSFSAQNYVRRALNVFLDNGLVAPEDDHLELIARSALEAQHLFFTVARYHPEEAQLNHFFDEFVLICALPMPVLQSSRRSRGWDSPSTPDWNPVQSSK